MVTKPSVNFNQPQRALNRDQVNLGESDYSTLLNGLFDGTDGGTFTLTNEMSNLLSSKFKEGFKVINATNDVYSNNTYFFLVNPTTGVGELGQIKNIQQVINIEDTPNDCEGCVEHLDLAEPLENQIQTELNSYETLLTDECHILNDEPEKGFNFNIKFPIKKTLIKNEKCGKTIYWTDNNEVPRYVVLDKLAQYLYTGNIVCGVDQRVPTCLDADKLPIFRRYDLPKLSPTSIQLGGRLKLGVYEFLIAYTDQLGNEISEYTSIANPIQIFDRNNVTLNPQELGNPTNFSIKLEVRDLDTRFSHYKIVVIQNTLDSAGAATYFVEGIHTINDNVIIYGGESGKSSNITLSDLLRENIFVEKWEFLTESQNSLIGAGITVEKEINLQPIVNLLPLKWQTHIAKEDLYKDGVAVSKYLSYPRDEVVPFSIRFLLQGGYKTARFPLINRLPTEEELQEVSSENKDRVSIESIDDCSLSQRTKYWQYYNTASVDSDFCLGGDIETTETTETVERTCTIENIFTIPANTYSIDLSYDFIDLRTYIEDNKDNCVSTPSVCPNPSDPNTFPFCNYLDINCYTDLNCTPDFNNQTTNEIIVGSEYIIYEIETGDNFTGTGYVSSGTPFTAISQPIIWINGTEVFKNSCDTPIKISEEIFVGEIIGESATKIELNFPEDYSDTILVNTCRIYKVDQNNNLIVDSRANGSFQPTPGNSYTSLMPCGQKIVVRDSTFSNTSQNSAQTILDLPEGTSTTSLPSFFNDYDISTTLATLLETKAANPIATGWNNKLHKKALWFGTNSPYDNFIIEITPEKLLDFVADDVSDGNTVRCSFYQTKTATTPFFTALVDLTTGGKFLFRKDVTSSSYSVEEEGGTVTPFPTIFSGIFYIAIDCKIVVDNTSNIINTGGIITCEEPSSPTSAYRIAPTNGCYSIITRGIEYSRLDVEFTSIVLNKQQTYTSICTFDKPIINSCKATPYKKGTFAYWESEQNYPDNESLYNSSTLKIKPSDIPAPIRVKFQNDFTQTTGGGVPVLNDGNYIWKLDNLGKPLIDFTCRPIRHFKFPDNKVSPFMYDSVQVSQSDSIIYPLGVTIDENTINSYLDIAVSNNIITQQKRDLITGYEIFRGNIDQDRSVISSGLLFNMRSYEKEGQVWNYSNYPYNDLGVDKLNPDSLGIVNNKFTYHSPETDYYKPTLPTELSIQGYVFGQTTNNRFEEVEEHPKYVILTNKAKELANLLAGLESATELAVIIAQSAEVYRTDVGLTTGLNIYGIVLNGIVTGTGIASVLLVNYGRYRLQWLKAFRDLGQPQNFAYYNHSSGKYNYFQPLQEPEQQIRRLHSSKYLKSGDYINVDDVTGVKTNVNNLDREKTVFLTLGDSTIEYPTQYKNYDNNSVDNNTGSLTYASENNACTKGKSKDILKNIASPYVAIKNYLPSQYGTINSINWLSTGYKGNLNAPLFSCTPIFGGDTFIARHTKVRKIPLFTIDNFGGGDLAPFAYKQYNNIGNTPRFFIDYETGDTSSSSTIKGSLFPDIFYDKELDCETKSGNYYKPPSKFYLYYYGVPNFLTETRINTWNRTAEEGLEKNFYPNVGDTGEITQQKNVSIKKEEYFFYNQIYSKPVTGVSNRGLYDNFNQAESDCRNDKPNGIMWSLPDNSENNYDDPYLIYNALDSYEFDSKYGKLKDIRTIEREQILVRQENATSLFNALDVAIDDGKRAETRNLASAFARRPMTYSETDLGYGGTQSSQSVSCEFGHFHVDAKRGQVIQIPTGGQGVEEISSLIGGKPSGMRNWFKEQLPFKILKSQIANIEDLDVDNAINGIGVTMGYDSRFRRVFITKKDYVPINPCLKFDKNTGFYDDCGEPVISCPDGYTYNPITEMCVKVTDSPNLCPTGYTYNQELGTCTLIEVSPADCEEESFSIFPINLVSANFIATPGTITTDWGDGVTNNLATHSYSSAFTGEIKIFTSLAQVKILQSLAGSGTRLEIKSSEIKKLTTLETLNATINSSNNFMTGELSDLPDTIKYLDIIRGSIGGTMADLPRNLEHCTLSMNGNTSITGDISDIPINVDYFVLGTNTVYGDLSGIADCTLLKTFWIQNGNSVSGDITNLPNSVENIRITDGNTISGSVATLASKTNLTSFVVTGSNTLTGSVANLPNSLVNFEVNGVSTLGGNITSMPSSINRFIVKSFQNIFTYTQGKIWGSYMEEVWISQLSFTTTDVDNILIDLANVTSWGGSREITLFQSRTSASDAAVATLISKGVTVNTN